MAFAIFWYRNEKAMKAGSPIFMWLMLLGGGLGLSSVFFLADINDWKCQTFPFVFGAGFMCLISSLYAKTWVSVCDESQLSKTNIQSLIGRELKWCIGVWIARRSNFYSKATVGQYHLRPSLVHSTESESPSSFSCCRG
jgi:hypothetical protein